MQTLLCSHRPGRLLQVAALAPSGFAILMLRMVPKLRDSLVEQLLKKEPPAPTS